MLRRATILLACLPLFAALPAAAQDATPVTVREINTIPDGNLQQLQAGGADLTLSEVNDLIASPYLDSTVTFTGVLMTEPFTSALRNDDDAVAGPDFVHGFIRDTTAASQGIEGMTIQFIEGQVGAPGTLSGSAVKGSVVTVTGVVDQFRGILQFAVSSVDVVALDYTELGFDESLVRPDTVTTAELNQALAGEVQGNWENFGALNGQYVRLEDAIVLDRSYQTTDAGEPDDAQVIVSTDGGETYVQLDTRYSTFFNNDRLTDPPYLGGDFVFRNTENPSAEPFIPPPPGARVNVMGFVKGPDSTFEPFTFSALPDGAWLQLIPYTAEDFEVLEEPAIRSVEPVALVAIPGDEAVTVQAAVDAEDGAVQSVEVAYTTDATTDEQTVTATLVDTVYVADIPAQEDGAFVTYEFRVLGDDNVVYTSSPATYRVLYDGINEIADIQTTADGGEGPSPFTGLTVPMNLTVVVMSAPDTTGFLAVQDGTDPYSGIFIRTAGRADLVADLDKGDVLTITEAEIGEFRDVDQLDDVVYTKAGTQAPYDPVAVTTDVLQDDAIAEAHEGMLLRFENVTVTSNNADGPDDYFGEFAFSSDGTEDNAVRADDNSDAISEEFARSLEVGQEIAFIEGIWSYSFGDFKLFPRTQADLPADLPVNVSTEDGDLPAAYALGQNYPNPFNPATEITYTLGQSGRATLEVVDLLGRRVALLVDREQAAGTYRLRFDGSQLASGLYLYRLQAGGQVITRTMTLLK